MTAFNVYAPRDDLGADIYFVESTAPSNVDESPPEAKPGDNLFVSVDCDDALKKIAKKLIGDPGAASGGYGNLVVMVHGFNNPVDSVWKTYRSAAEAVLDKSSGIAARGDRLVCIGYRWPSERMFAPWRSTFSALPFFARWSFWLSLIAFAITMIWSVLPAIEKADAKTQAEQLWYVAQEYFRQWSPITLTMIYLVWAVSITGFLLRAVVYFRDGYRANQYGIPDLVEIIRKIDEEVRAQTPKDVKQPSRIALSFIGHSMGGYVVTSVVRILSDVFDPAAVRASDTNNDEPQGGAVAPTGAIDWKEAFTRSPDATADVRRRSPSEIGHVFTLMRLVLVSPDIPAEALIGNRANFLKSSLRRFQEAYLFSSEGDEVLRMISTWANYFSFPTASTIHGYRLGNVEVLADDYGVLSFPQESTLDYLRVGVKSIAFLNGSTSGANPGDEAPAYTFSYVDCADYIDDPGPRGYLTTGRRHKKGNVGAAMKMSEHLYLFLRWLIPDWKFLRLHINVHGGYFEGPMLRALIYQFACLGMRETLRIYGAKDIAKGFDTFDETCRTKQIKFLPSVFLPTARETPYNAMSTNGKKPEPVSAKAEAREPVAV